ncbi:type III restriction endonuclease subunit R [Kocuria rosea]|nr:DEAD/DEAH box helicase family protein [Kocuria rosea]THE17821.1 type III restriction endonuclease subunit R [Kocuria rosea]
MRFTLKDYQDQAVSELLSALRDARMYYEASGRPQAVTLTATMGAGKTVIASALLEALFTGDEDVDFEADPKATVLWFSSDPALNEQSRFRLLEATDMIPFSDLVVVPTTFNQRTFDPGKVYFLNHQKFSRTSLLVRGFEERQAALPLESMPDGREYTIWDTIRNTIEDPDRTLYMFVDEAHQGMGQSKSAARAHESIVQRIINGQPNTVPRIRPVPIILGITATPQRLHETLETWDERLVVDRVKVSPVDVQASGLLKDTYVLDSPAEAGAFDQVLLRRAVDRLREMTEAWAEYARTDSDGQTVTPLMILQLPNTPDPDDVGQALDTIFQQWPALAETNVAHVLGEHTTQRFGSHEIPYISPEEVQDHDWCQVLIAKDAISTGWDCPRAEVMLSFRPASDRTHITQLLGRMARTPLARRIPGNDLLSSVYCFLPHFAPTTTREVADALTYGDENMPPVPGRRALIDPIEVTSEHIGKEVWDVFTSLPSMALPKTVTNPVKRLTLLAHELAADDIMPGAGARAHELMHHALDGAAATHRTAVETSLDEVRRVEVSELFVDRATGARTTGAYTAEADEAVIEEAFRRAGRVFGKAVTMSYASYLADQEIAADEEADEVEALIEAQAQIAAMSRVPAVIETFNRRAEELADEWFTTHRVPIAGLSPTRQEEYRKIKQQARTAQAVSLAKPERWLVPSYAQTGNDETTREELPRYPKHLLMPVEGDYPEEFKSSWEPEVLSLELARESLVCWYRNPGVAKPESLAAVYSEGDQQALVRPDFIMFDRAPDGRVVASIVDPHGHHYGDALPKLRGLSAYAEQHGDHYARIDSIAKVGGQLRVLDLKDSHVRESITQATSVEALYNDQLALDYRG